MHQYPGRQLPAQQPDRDLRDREGVGGVPALLGVGGGVRGPAPVVDRAVCDGERVGLGDVHGAGWHIIARCTPSKTPRSSGWILPPPPSSAGVPNTVTRRPSSSATGAGPAAAPTALAAITSCPQAWPSPGSASYSAHTPTCSGPVLRVAVNAVGSPPAPGTTV